MRIQIVKRENGFLFHNDINRTSLNCWLHLRIVCYGKLCSGSFNCFGNVVPNIYLILNIIVSCKPACHFLIKFP